MTTLLTEWDKNFFCASFTTTMDTSSIYRIHAYQPCCCADGWALISTSENIQPLFMVLGNADQSFKTIVDHVIVAPDSEPNETIYKGPAAGCCAEMDYDITNHKIVFQRKITCCGCIPAGSQYDAIWLPTIVNYTLATPFCEACCKSMIFAYPHRGQAPLRLELPDAKGVFSKLVALHKKRMQNQFASAAASIGNGQLMVPAVTQPTSFVALPNNVVPTSPGMTRDDDKQNK